MINIKTHKIKCIQPYFNNVWVGYKTCEVRKNDRNYITGDKLILEEWSIEANEYGKGKIECWITHIIDDEKYCKKGYVILSIKVIRCYSQ